MPMRHFFSRPAVLTDLPASIDVTAARLLAHDYVAERRLARLRGQDQ